MKVVLVTGLIGSGKSEVCRLLASMGHPVYDCDSRTKALYTPELKERVEKAIGMPFSEVSRIFSDPVAKRALEAVVFPEVRRDIELWLQALECGRTAFVESATAQESPVFDGLFDEVLEVWAPLPLRISRNPKAEERSACQSRPRNPDYIIRNDGTPQELALKVKQYYNENRSF